MPLMTLVLAAATMDPVAVNQPPPEMVVKIVEAIDMQDGEKLAEHTGGLVGYDIYSRNPQKVASSQMMADLRECRHVKTEEWESKFWMTTWLCDENVPPNEYCEVPGYGVQLSWRYGPYVTAYFKEDMRTDQPCKSAPVAPAPAYSRRPTDNRAAAPAAAKQLADAVTAGASIAGSHYAPFFSDAQSRWLSGLAGCSSSVQAMDAPGTPPTAVILWQCAGRQPALTAVMLWFEKEKIVRITPLGDFSKAK